MKFAKPLILSMLALLLGAGLVYAGDEAAVSIAIAPAVPSIVSTLLDLTMASDDATCAVQESSPVLDTVPRVLAASGGSLSCNYCTSSAQCQPICGGQIGSDFVCHFDFDCEFGRVCICFN